MIANAIAERLTGRDYISYSALSTFAQCPLKYYFRYCLGMAEETVSASLVFGVAIHAAIQQHFEELLQGNPAPGIESLRAAYRQAWGQFADRVVLYGKGDDVATLSSLAERMLAVFQASELASCGGTILGIEEELRGKLLPGCPDLLARLDLTVDTGTEIRITDLKTARARWSPADLESASGQLLLYHELIKPLASGKTISLEFAVLTKTKVPTLERHPVPVDPNRLARTKKTAERIWQAIQAGNFYPVPSPMNCSTCPFREPCRDWKG